MGHTSARTNRSRLMFVGIATILVVLATSLAVNQRPANAGGYSFTGAERCLMRKINYARHRHGLHRLRHDRQISYVARRHARRMARSRSVWDDAYLPFKVTHWRSLGQNSGAAARCKRVFKALMRSPVHKANILGHYRFMGVGTTKRHGKLWVNQVFESRRNPGNKWHYP